MNLMNGCASKSFRVKEGWCPAPHPQPPPQPSLELPPRGSSQLKLHSLPPSLSLAAPEGKAESLQPGRYLIIALLSGGPQSKGRTETNRTLLTSGLSVCSLALCIKDRGKGSILETGLGGWGGGDQLEKNMSMRNLFSGKRDAFEFLLRFILGQVSLLVICRDAILRIVNLICRGSKYLPKIEMCPNSGSNGQTQGGVGGARGAR